MKISIAAVTFAIAASFASGQDNGTENTSSPAPSPSGRGKSGKSGGTGGTGSGKSGKSGGGTKSGKSGDCTSCSTDVLTRANTVTSLSFQSYGNEDGDLDYQSVVDFCCNPEEREAFLAAVVFISGCLVYKDCLLEDTFFALADPPLSNATITEGEFLTVSVNQLCLAEQIGEKLPIGGEGCPTPDELCSRLPFGACGGNPVPPQRN
jgi:hypothetical protein